MKTKLKTFFFFIFLLGFTQGLEAKEYEIKDYLNPNNPDRKAYIEKYKEIAMQEMARHRIPASIKLAQGILESGDGKSSLATNANNHFGMKCGTGWSGETFYLKDDDYDSNGNLVKSCFRSYEEPEESYYAHSLFLRNEAKKYRYGFLFDLDPKDYKAWAKGLKKSGYATNPKYADLLIGIIEANQLYKFDQLSHIPIEFPEWAVTSIPSGPVSSEVDGKPDNIGVKNEVVMNNGLKMIFARKGDTPRSIGDFFGIKPKKLSKYNEFYESGRMPLATGDRVYLQAKRRSWRGTEKVHVVKHGQTMYEISQMYGIKIEKLYKKNRMTPGTEPERAQKIYVRGSRNRDDIVKLRKKKLYASVPDNIPDSYKPTTPALEDDKNVADLVRTKVSSFDLNKRVDAYAKITDGTYRPAPTHPTPAPPRPTYPSTTYPSHPTTTHPSPPTPPRPQPDIVTYPTTPPPPPTHTGGGTYPTPTYPTTQPQPTPPQPVVTPPTPPRPSAPAAQYHTVQGGETLYAISKKYNVSVGQIKTLNGLGSNLISVGQQLRVR